MDVNFFAYFMKNIIKLTLRNKYDEYKKVQYNFTVCNSRMINQVNLLCSIIFNDTKYIVTLNI